MSDFDCGTVVSISWLSGREDGGDPFQVLLYAIQGLERTFSPEQREAFDALEQAYLEIGCEDMEEVAMLMYDDDVYTLMQPFAPKDHSWGSHPEGCLGFWPDDWDE
jgi:hypothetical protein